MCTYSNTEFEYSKMMLQKIIDVTSSALCRLKKFYRKVTSIPANTAEEEDNLKMACKFFHTLYFLYFADFWLLKSVPALLRFVINTLIVFFVLSGYMYFLISMLNGAIVFDVEVCLSTIFPMCVHMAMYILRPIFYYYFDDYIKTVFDYISTYKTKISTTHLVCKGDVFSGGVEDAGSSIPTANLFQKENVIKVPGLILITGIFTSIILTSFPPILYVIGSDDRLPDVRDYYTLFPFYDHIESPISYYVLATLTSIFGFYELISAYFSITFLYISCCIMKYNALDVSAKMRVISQNVIGEYERRSIAEEKNSDQTIVMKSLFSTFEKYLIQWLREYRKFKTMGQITLLTFMNTFFTLTIISGTGMMFGVVAVLMVVSMDTSQKVGITLMLPFLGCGLFTCCFIAKAFEDVGDIYRYAVYDVPWYYLPPRTRKIINIFQNMVLNYPEIRVLRVYPVNMSLFPRLWNSVYSYAGILRVRMNS